MKKALFILALLLCLSSLANAKNEVAFTPSLECENKIISLINNAKHSIDIAVYAINNDNIVEALLAAHQRNIKIRILTDRLQASNRSSKVKWLQEQGLDVRIHRKYKLEHNKFAIFDERTVSTGSFNWTNPASTKNSENCLFITEENTTIQNYETRFDELWLLNSRT